MVLGVLFGFVLLLGPRFSFVWSNPWCFERPFLYQNISCNSLFSKKKQILTLRLRKVWMWDFKVRNGRCFLLKENFAAVHWSNELCGSLCFDRSLGCKRCLNFMRTC